MSDFDLNTLDPMHKAMLTSLIEKPGHLILMRWKEDEDPRTATIGGKEIRVMQDGYFTHNRLADLGWFDWLVKSGGADNRSNVIIIVTPEDKATNPNGTPCEDVTHIRGFWKIALGQVTILLEPTFPEETTSDNAPQMFGPTGRLDY